MMVGVRRRGEEIRTYIIDNVGKYPSSIVKEASKKFDITSQAVNKHIKRLVQQDSIQSTGTTRNRRYSLTAESKFHKKYSISPDLKEDSVWREDLQPILESLPDNVLDIWHYGMTEMINNVIDHSSGKSMDIHLTKTAREVNAMIIDDGEGIFAKIRRVLKLENQSHAVLELSKGKLTTDPQRHSGEGIFFTSRALDRFAIMSGEVNFSHKYEDIEDWVLEREDNRKGTVVFMDLSNNTARTIKIVFDQYSSDDDYGFNKTIIPVKLARYGNENLVSRSQAKRLLARVDKFKIVVFDFDNIEMIGQAFADEVFRVFNNIHPNTELMAINTTSEVEKMISRAAAVST